MSERDPNERGALWEKTSAKGTYFTGTIDGQPCVVFKNGNKEPGSKAPDWRVLRPKPRDENAPAAGHNLNEPIADADIPF